MWSPPGGCWRGSQWEARHDDHRLSAHRLHVRWQAHVEGTGIKVDLIATVYTLGGASPEMIVADYPPLTLGQVHSALAYYFDHKDEMDRQIVEDERMAEQIRAKHDSSPRLRERLKAQGPLP